MKKSYIALAVLAMAALAGCQENEITNEVYTLEKGEVLIRLANGRQTKSMDAASVIEGATIELGTDENGTNFVLEETITNLDNLSFAPETKGTPGYTENFADLYKGFNAAVYKGGSVYEADGAFEEYDKANLIYKRKYPNDIWDGNGEPDLYFFLRTPASYIDANITSDLSYNTTNGSISFSYTSPTTADAQQDMLFTSRPLNTAADFNDLFIKDDQGLPVLFHHALTGVKFAIGNAAEDNVTITKVEFTGLKTSGSCVITPIQENGKYEDNHTNYSSATAVVWTPGTATAAISQEYNSVTSYEQPGTGVSKFAENYYQGGNSNNLSKDNDATAAQTFWLIPQTLTDDVKLTVSYSIDGKAQEPWEIDFGSALKKNGNFINWQAGELRTYTLKVDAVKVHIEDQMEPSKVLPSKTRAIRSPLSAPPSSATGAQRMERQSLDSPISSTILASMSRFPPGRLITLVVEYLPVFPEQVGLEQQMASSTLQPPSSLGRSSERLLLELQPAIMLANHSSLVTPPRPIILITRLQENTLIHTL